MVMCSTLVLGSPLHNHIGCVILCREDTDDGYQMDEKETYDVLNHPKPLSSPNQPLLSDTEGAAYGKLHQVSCYILTLFSHIAH